MTSHVHHDMFTMYILLPWYCVSVVEGDASLDEGAETLTLTFPQPLPLGKASVCVKYKGLLNDKMKGFYRSKYTTPSGEERFGAVTQFEVCVRVCVCVYVCAMCMCVAHTLVCACSMHALV